MAEELLEFRNLEGVLIDNVDIPTLPGNRRCTDIIGVVLCLLFLVIPLGVLFGLTLSKADFRRLEYTYDDCCNMCGHKNDKIPDLWCSGRDYTNKKFGYNGECLEECPKDTIKNRYFNNCKKNETDEIMAMIRKSIDKVLYDWWKIPLIALLALVLGAVLLCGLRYLTAFTVRASMIMAIVLCIVMAVVFGLQNSKSSDDESAGYAFIFGVLAVVVIIVVICSWKHLPLIIQLFKQSSKDLWDMPTLFLVLILSYVGIVCLGVVCAYATIGLYTSWEAVFEKNSKGNVTKQNDGYYCFYKLSDLSKVAVILNYIVFIWGSMFWSELIYMVMSGFIATKFLTRNKGRVIKAMCTSFSTTFRYHVGTVGLGSFIMIIVYIPQFIIEKLFQRFDCSSCIVEGCCQCIIDVLNYCKKRTYIETAIHGEPFCKSAKRAMNLISDNFPPAIKVLIIKSTVLSVMIILVLTICVGVTTAIVSRSGNIFIFLIVVVVVCVVVYLLFTVIDVVVDVMFICYCEDVAINNGTTRAYYMPNTVMRFVEKAKKRYKPREPDDDD